MDKLGFAIKLASQGTRTVLECNKDQWTSKVVDIRQYINLFTGLQGTDNIVAFLSFDEGGCFLTQFRAIYGRAGDFLSGWIYIPNSIEITGEQLLNAYNYVHGILMQSSIAEMKDNIDSFFSNEYPKNDCPVKYSPSRKGQSFAYRKIGYYSLKEILESGSRYQTYYSDYEAIFLLEDNGSVDISKEHLHSFKDLTEREIVKTAILIPPTLEELSRYGKGTKLLTSDGKQFASALPVERGKEISLKLSREGFESIPLIVTVSSEKQRIDLSSQEIKWQKKIVSSLFDIRDEQGDTIHNASISVNGKQISYQVYYFNEEECKNAIVKIKANRYEDYEGQHNLLVGKIPVTMQKKSYSYDQNSRVSSISKGFVWKQRVLGFVAGAIIVTLISLVIRDWDKWVSPEEPTDPTGTTVVINNPGGGDVGTQTEEPSEPVPTLKDATKYLDDNDVWDKSVMEAYPDLKGLYDDMNNFNLDNLVGKWKTKLKDSSKFQKVCESARKTKNNGWNPKQVPHKQGWNKEDDETITIKYYIWWLDKDQTPRNGSQTQPSSSSGKSESSNPPVDPNNKGQKKVTNEDL